MSRLLARLAVVVALLGPLTARADLGAVEALYAAGDFDAASQRLNALLAHDEATAAGERARLYLMKARLELAYGRKQELRLWLTKAHRADPTLTLDPVLDPPQLAEAWAAVQREPPAPTVGPEGAAPFVALLLPLGGGHFVVGRYRDAAFFLSTELLLLLSASVMGDDGRFAGATLLGAYGYELTDRLGEMGADGSGTGGIRGVLSLFPFGVAQAKNGATGKAMTVAALHAGLLGVGVLSPDARQRAWALGALGATWLVAMVDGFVNDPGDGPAGEQEASLSPTLVPSASGLGVGLALRARF